MIAFGEVLVFAPCPILEEFTFEQPSGDIPLHPGDEKLLDHEFVEWVGVLVLEFFAEGFDFCLDFGDGLVDVARDCDARFLVRPGDAAKGFEGDAPDVAAEFLSSVGSEDLGLVQVETFGVSFGEGCWVTHFDRIFLFFLH